MINNQIKKTIDLKEEIRLLSKRCLREETKTHSAIHLLDKKRYLNFKKKYKIKLNEIFLKCYTGKIKGQICFIFPDMSNIDNVLRKYSNLCLFTLFYNERIAKEHTIFIERYPFMNVQAKHKYELIRVEDNKESYLPPYARFNYICKYGNKGEIVLNSHSNQVA